MASTKQRFTLAGQGADDRVETTFLLSRKDPLDRRHLQTANGTETIQAVPAMGVRKI